MLGQWAYNEEAGADIRFNNASRIMKCNYNSTLGSRLSIVLFFVNLVSRARKSVKQYKENSSSQC
jgi:hypothetical protein